MQIQSPMDRFDGSATASEQYRKGEAGHDRDNEVVVHGAHQFGKARDRGRRQSGRRRDEEAKGGRRHRDTRKRPLKGFMVVDPGPAEPDADEGGDAVEKREHHEPGEGYLSAEEEKAEERPQSEEKGPFARNGIPPFKTRNDPGDDRNGVAPGDGVGEDEPHKEREYEDGEGDVAVEEVDKTRDPEAEDKMDDLPERLVHLQ